MEILGIGPGEFVLILIVLLVVVGPERLPGLARQAGGMLVRVRNWLQTSPDAALVLRARQEIEAELASLKTSLLEVQSVRDEVLGAAKQLEESVSSITSTKLDLNGILETANEHSIAPHQQPAPDLVPATTVPEASPIADVAGDLPAALELPDGTAVPIGQPQVTHGQNGTAPTAAPALAELESINVRLHAIMSDLWALQEQLKQRGALDQGWPPPSWDIQLPAAVGASSEAGETATEANPATPPEVAAPVAKTRRRRAAAAPEASPASELETTAPAAPAAAKTRKRRAAAARNAELEPTEESETIASEEAP
jgi:sec-independent protein translocase protein TatB